MSITVEADVNSIDKRSDRRFRCSIPIEMAHGIGLTRDCSASGVYFLTDEPLAVGQSIEFVMLMTSVIRGEAVRLRCRGHVLRVEPGRGKVGVALAYSVEGAQGTA